MRSVCSQAKAYGDEILPDGAANRRIIVLLNPAANKRAAEKKFEKFCTPILYLSGARIDIVKTESEGYARSYVETELQQLPDAILVAGGDGTLSEVVTGLLRRSAGDSSACPIGVLPVGRTNTVAGQLFPRAFNGGRLEEARQLTEAAMSVVRGQQSKRDVLKIEILPEAETVQAQQESDLGAEMLPVVEPKKPVYALASIKWGAFRDAMALRDKYWYFGGFRQQAAILFNAFRRSRVNWDCPGTMITTPPCDGCTACFGSSAVIKKPEYKSRNWWAFLVPTKSSKQETSDEFTVNGQDMRKRVNVQCSSRTERQLEDVNELLLTTRNVEGMEESPRKAMKIRLGDATVSKTDWILDAWQREADELNSRRMADTILCKTMELIPTRNSEGPEVFYSIDNEAFELRPIRVTVLPRQISMFVM